MINYEDEKDIIASGAPAIVPFLMQEENNGIEFEIYSGAKAATENFILAFEGRYFSDFALISLNDALAPYLTEKGYATEKHGMLRWYRRYTIAPGAEVAGSVVLPTTRMLDKEYPSLVTFSAKQLLEEKLPAFITLENEKIVSIATVNEHGEGQRMLEITVETAPSYRGRGYARSNVAALASHLIHDGYSAAYCCSRYNTASKKIAEKVGFAYGGKFYAVAAYKR